MDEKSGESTGQEETDVFRNK